MLWMLLLCISSQTRRGFRSASETSNAVYDHLLRAIQAITACHRQLYPQYHTKGIDNASRDA